MDPKSDEGIFLGYSTNSRAYKVFNSRTQVLIESINVIVDDQHEDFNVIEGVGTFFETQAEGLVKTEDSNDSPPESKPEAINKDPSIRIQKDQPKELIIGDLSSGVITRSREIIANSCFVSKIEFSCMLNSKLDQMSKSIRMLNNGTDSLEEILQVGQKAGDMSGIGFVAYALIAQTSLRVSAKEEWYFDSGCSKHMTGIKNLLEDIKPNSTSYVTFYDRAKGEIKGVGKLECPVVPKLENVLLVKGLTANLISISQLCDQGFNVRFTKDECVITNEENMEVMKGVRSKDNCYLWEPKTTSYPSVCSMAKEEKEVKLWHQKLGHLHLRGMNKIISKEAVRGIPKLQINEGKVFKDLCTRLQREKESGVIRIRSDHGKEFENAKFAEFCSFEGISHEFSSPITPKQNGVVERKNMTIQESARAMIHAKKLPMYNWAEAMNTTCYVHNRVTLTKGTSSTLY
ncbi:uncharacterized protein LOC131659095 [Vicia villosa]|uniref:uncharacterized protein LOC131659095 n=1 Tax=Vicia villosa TaxID=3911 RepID=UPI00273CC3FA|nr:uncharacterized protein LOC131659095 [Vicia villosa]